MVMSSLEFKSSNRRLKSVSYKVRFQCSYFELHLLDILNKLFVANLAYERKGSVYAYVNEGWAVYRGFDNWCTGNILDRRSVLSLILLGIFVLPFCSKEFISRKECQIKWLTFFACEVKLRNPPFAAWNLLHYYRKSRQVFALRFILWI